MSIYRLVVDQDRCIACHACEASCKAAHDSAPGISLGTLLVDGPRFEDAAEEATPIIVKHARPEAPAPLVPDGEPRVVLHTRYRACVQCPQPRCVEACPKEALIRRKSDGIVFIREETCVGICRRLALHADFPKRSAACPALLRMVFACFNVKEGVTYGITERYPAVAGISEVSIHSWRRARLCRPSKPGRASKFPALRKSLGARATSRRRSS